MKKTLIITSLLVLPLISGAQGLEMNTRAQIKTDPVSTNTEFRAQVEARKEQAEEQHAQIQANVEMRQANREERRANFALEVRARLDTIAEKIIYEAIEYIEKRLSGLLEPDIKEISLGSAEVQKIFKVSKFGQIAGSKVIEGEIQNKSKARIVRDGSVVYDGEIISIFREKNAVKEVKNGLECGISLRDFIDFKEKDIIESYQIQKIERTI